MVPYSLLPLNTKLESINYVCTGTADSTAIATLINNFFNSGTAMAMKITITGTMGIAFTNNAAMYINATNTRGTVCYLDFSNCHIPTITTASSNFLNISSTTARLDIFGLVVKTTYSGIYLNNAKNNSFNDCTITNTALSSTVAGVYIIGNSGDNIFHNCTISGNFCGVRINSTLGSNRFDNCTINTSDGTAIIVTNSNNDSFSNCMIKGTGDAISVYNNSNKTITIMNCAIIGDSYGIQATGTSNTNAVIKLIGCSIKGTSTQDIYQQSPASSVKWYIMGCSFSRASIIIDGTTAITYKTGTYVYMPQYANFFSQTIS